MAGPGAEDLQRLVERDIENAWLAANSEAGPLDDLIGHSITYCIAVSPRAGVSVSGVTAVAGGARRFAGQGLSPVRSVETVGFMTAHWARLPYEFLDVVARRIVNEVKGISRVVYDVSGKPQATIEWE